MLCSRDFAILCYCHDHYAGWFSYGKVALVAVHGLIDMDTRWRWLSGGLGILDCHPNHKTRMLLSTLLNQRTLSFQTFSPFASFHFIYVFVSLSVLRWNSNFRSRESHDAYTKYKTSGYWRDIGYKDVNETKQKERMFEDSRFLFYDSGGNPESNVRARLGAIWYLCLSVHAQPLRQLYHNWTSQRNDRGNNTIWRNLYYIT